jgi:hypothetical protein
MTFRFKTFILLFSLVDGLPAQEKTIELAPIATGTLRVRPAFATRTPIQLNNGAALFLNSPLPVEVAILDPTNRRITQANASGTGLSILTQPASESPLQVVTGEGFLTTVEFPPLITPGNWRLEVTSTNPTEFEAKFLILDDSPVRFQLFSKSDSLQSDRDAVISAALFDGGTAVAGAQVSVEMDCRRDVTALMQQTSWLPISSVLEGDERVFRSVLKIKSNAVSNVNDLTLILSPQSVGYSSNPRGFSIGSLAPGDTWTSPEFEVRQPRGTFLPFFSLQFEARGQRQTLPLWDSGDGDSDGRSGDGLYGAKIRPLNPGTCAFQASASGTSGSGIFQRSAYQEIPVTAVLGSIGAVTDFSEDSNSDGKPEVIGMNVQVNVRNAGLYRLDATLEQGEKYASLSTEQTLVAGQNTMTLTLAAEQARMLLGSVGPFRRTDLRLMRLNGGNIEFVDKRESAGSSAPWSLGGQDYTVRLNGVPTLLASPLPLPASGYKELKFSVPVLITQPGSCSWQVTVAQRNGEFRQTIDEYIDATGTMPFSGNLTGSIPGWKIRRAQAGGVFEIQSATVNCPGPMGRWIGESIVRSEPYRSADFENPIPSFELSAQYTNPARLVMSRSQSRTNEFFFEVEALAGFENNLSCTLSPDRPGITAVFDRMPSRTIDWPIKILVTVGPLAIPGPSPLTISCIGRGVTKTAVLALSVN